MWGWYNTWSVGVLVDLGILALWELYAGHVGFGGLVCILWFLKWWVDTQ